MTRKYEIIEREVRYQGFFRLERYRLRHELFSGGMSRVLTRELFERGHAAAVLPYDPERDAVVLIEQFRIGALDDAHGPWLLEIVAGVTEAGEGTEDLVRREAVEEAGCALQELQPICEFLVSPGGTSERISLFCGRVDSTTVNGMHGVHEEGEDIMVHVLPLQEALRAVTQGRIRSASPIIALQWLALHRDEVRALWGAH
jgi:ADP-ribose pyrophosphatase